jgi:hypothetical protein
MQFALGRMMAVPQATKVNATRVLFSFSLFSFQAHSASMCYWTSNAYVHCIVTGGENAAINSFVD